MTAGKLAPAFLERVGAFLQTERRIAVLGIGQELNGDDGAGVQLVRALQAHVQPRPNLLLLDAGAMPENFSGPLRRFQPERVLFLDAAWMEQPAGDVRFLLPGELQALALSTHALPLPLLAAFLETELVCLVAFIGIQAAATAFDSPLSPPVQAAVAALTDALTPLL